MESGYEWLGLGGRVCVVTGAAQGIGAAIAIEFARAGCGVALLDLEAKRCAGVSSTIESFGGHCVAISVDVSNADSVAEAAEASFRELGPVDVLVNNAGISSRAPILDVDLALWNRVLSINVNGALNCAQAFGKQMVSQRSGSMIHIGSLSGLFPQPQSGPYSVSKSAVAMLSQLLAYELAPKGIRSNVISPGSVRTPQASGSYRDSDMVEKRKSMIPAGRFGETEDIATAALFLASDRAGFVTGQNLVIDGGYSQALMGLMPRAAPTL